MVRMSKLTDYAIVLLTLLATEEGAAPHNAREVAARAHLPFPVVSKILKALARAGLLVSHRGAKGGYALARPPEEISVAEAIRAMEGPIALIECAAGPGHCQQEATCEIRSPWQRVQRSRSASTSKGCRSPSFCPRRRRAAAPPWRSASRPMPPLRAAAARASPGGTSCPARSPSNISRTANTSGASSRTSRPTRCPPGLDEDVIRLISAKKDEPEWLLDWRLKAYRRWLKMTEPEWATVSLPPIDYQAIVYYSAPKQQKPSSKSLDEVDPEAAARPTRSSAFR